MNEHEQTALAREIKDQADWSKDYTAAALDSVRSLAKLRERYSSHPAPAKVQEALDPGKLRQLENLLAEAAGIAKSIRSAVAAAI